MKKVAKLNLSQLAKKAAKIKVNKRLDDGIAENSPFVKKKMEKAARMLAVAGVPKI